MKKQILICVDSFEKIVGGNYFYVDKTLFIKELFENYISWNTKTS